MGLSLRDVARRLTDTHNFSVAPTTISNYEGGRTSIKPAMLAALAAVYGRPVDSILSSVRPLHSVRYRALKSVRQRDKAEFEGRARDLFEIYFRVEALVGQSLRSRRHASFSIKSRESGRSVAQRLRALYELGNYPLPSAIRLLENFGIRVIQVDTKARIDALAGWTGTTRVVALNSQLSNDRLRITALHELAHHLYEDCSEGALPPHDELEKRAFEFASHMLLPEDELIEAFRMRSMVRLVQYKERFGVSLAAMIYRARLGSHIPQRLYERLWREFGRLGYRQNEPGYVSPDRPMRMEALVDTAVGEGLTSYEEFGQSCGMTADDLHDRVLRAMGGSIRDANPEANPSSYNFEAYRHD